MKVLNISMGQTSQGKNRNVQFKACVGKSVDHSAKWSWNKLRILERSESEMKEMAEYFHKKDDWELRQIAEGNSVFVSDDKIQSAYEKLKTAVDIVLSKKEQIEDKINSGSVDRSTLNILESELERLDEKAENTRMIEKLYKKSF